MVHFHEALKQSIEDYEHERKQLEQLFFEESMPEENLFAELGCVPETPLADNISPVFRTFRWRGTSISLRAFFAVYAARWKTPSLDGLLLYCEILLNILHEFRARLSGGRHSASIAQELLRNIDIILEKTNHKIREREDGILEILQKDALAATVGEDLTDADTARAVLEYTHYGLKGNLEKKRDLLVIIGRHVEPILDDLKMKEFCNWLLDDVSSCLNNLHIRHNNQEGKKKNDLVGEMNAQELEAIYDETYRAMLLLIEMQKHRPVHEKIKAMHKHLEESRSAKGRGKAGGEASPHAAKRRRGKEARAGGEDAGGVERGRVGTEGQ